MEPSVANWDHCLETAALSDLGLRRANNQDSMAVVTASSQEMWQEHGHLFMVADGMGAHAAGELASKLACDTVALTYPKLRHLSPPEAILTALRDANDQIHRRGTASPDFKGMGTTVTSLLLLPEGALMAHAGDSRAYRLRGNCLQQLTFDHSLLWEMRAAGHLSQNDLVDHIPKNIITRSLGPNPSVQIDLEGPFAIEPGDTFLLCSDGLSGQVPDEEMGTILACMPPSEAVRALVDLANLRGGPDNITVIVVRVTGPQTARSPGGSDGSLAPALPGTHPVSPLIWTLLGASALGAAGLAAMRYWLVALLFLAGAVASAIVAVVQRYGTAQAEFLPGGPPLGRGPYSQCLSIANEALVQQLREIVAQLRDAASQEKRMLDWQGFDRLVERAAAAAQSADYAVAVREYCLAMSFMMAQLKGRRDRSDDSNVIRF